MDECVKTVREKSTKKPNKRKKGTRAEDSNTGETNCNNTCTCDKYFHMHVCTCMYMY